MLSEKELDEKEQEVLNLINDQGYIGWMELENADPAINSLIEKGYIQTLYDFNGREIGGNDSYLWILKGNSDAVNFYEDGSGSYRGINNTKLRKG